MSDRVPDLGIVGDDPTREPTEREIQRVATHRRREDQRQLEIHRARRENAHALILERLTGTLTGRTIVSATGQLKGDLREGFRVADADWTELKLTLDDGRVLTITPERFTEEYGLDLELGPA